MSHQDTKTRMEVKSLGLEAACKSCPTAPDLGKPFTGRITIVSFLLIQAFKCRKYSYFVSSGKSLLKTGFG